MSKAESCTAREAPSPTFPTLTEHRGSTAQSSHRHEDAGKDPSSGFRGFASQLGVEPMQLPSERGAQPGAIFCSITHPATLGGFQRKHCPHMPELQRCSQLLAFRGHRMGDSA